MPVLGQFPTEIHLVDTATVTWTAGAPYPDPNFPDYAVRDVMANATGGGSSAAAAPEENEIVSFGTGTTGTLAYTPSVLAGFTQVKLYKNGQRLTPGAGNDFTWSGATITLAIAALSTDVFEADYYRSSSFGIPVVNEVVAFTGTSGTLANTPSSLGGYTEVALFRNGVRQTPGAGNDFTWAGAAITLAVAALSTDDFLADYYK